MKTPRSLATLLLLALTLSFFTACSGKLTPKDPLWDRETCAHCRMTISERRYAAQILGPGSSLRYYDDLGCALRDRHEKGLQGGQLWVRPHGGEQWAEASQSRYQSGLHTPMGFGFGAVTQGGNLSLAEVETAVLESKP